jgi:hypothetical protein
MSPCFLRYLSIFCVSLLLLLCCPLGVGGGGDARPSTWQTNRNISNFSSSRHNCLQQLSCCYNLEAKLASWPGPAGILRLDRDKRDSITLRPMGISSRGISPNLHFASCAIHPGDISPHRHFAPWTFRPMEISPCWHLAPWTFHSMKISPHSLMRLPLEMWPYGMLLVMAMCNTWKKFQRTKNIVFLTIYHLLICMCTYKMSRQ